LSFDNISSFVENASIIIDGVDLSEMQIKKAKFDEGWELTGTSESGYYQKSNMYKQVRLLNLEHVDCHK